MFFFILCRILDAIKLQLMASLICSNYAKLLLLIVIVFIICPLQASYILEKLEVTILHLVCIQ